MKFLNNINAKRKLKNMNNSLNKVFLSTNKDEFHSNLEHAIKIHNDAEHDLDDSYLFPENDHESKLNHQQLANQHLNLAYNVEIV